MRIQYKKFFLVAFVLIFIGVFLSSCGQADQPTKAFGAYQNSDKTFYADVRTDTIKVYLINDDFKSLYWSGTWGQGDKVISKANTKDLDESITGSEDKTKTFKYTDGKISFEYGMMGMSGVATLEKQ